MQTLEDRIHSLEELIRTVMVPGADAPLRVTQNSMNPSSQPVFGSTNVNSTSIESAVDSAVEALQLNPVARSQQRTDLPAPTDLSAIHTSNDISHYSHEIESTESISWDEPVAEYEATYVRHGPVPTDLDLRPRAKVSKDRICTIPSPEAAYFLLQEYLVDFNMALPLFNAKTIFELFQDCYNGRADGKVLSWVAMKLVLAIAHRLRAMSPLGVAQDQEITQIYLDDTLAQMPSIVKERPSLLLCQCYLALVFVFLTSFDSHPAAMFASTAVRIAQDLMKDIQSQTLPEQIQRQRLLWIAYSQDADLSLKAGRIPTLNSTLLEADLPLDDFSEGVGEVRATSGDFRINAFRLLAEISLIETELARTTQPSELLSSTDHEYMASLQVTDLKLDHWRRRWIFALTPLQLYQLLHRSDLVHVIVLEARYLVSLFSLLARKDRRYRGSPRLFSAGGILQHILKTRSPQAVSDARHFLGLVSLIPGDDIALNW